MICAACGSQYQVGDRFCGTCGDRLPEAAPNVLVQESPPPDQSGMLTTVMPSAPDAPFAMPPPPRIEEAAGPACPVCGATLAAGVTRCDVCGFEPGASVVVPGASAPPPRALGNSDASAPGRVCPVHGPLDPSWTRCPYCLKEGREGRLPSGPVGIRHDPPPAPPDIEAEIEAVSVAPRMEPPEAIVPAAPPEPQPVPLAPPPVMPPPPRAPDLPQSSVGATFAIRRRPRVLAYLIEKAGEAVGRIHQLDDDVTDIGRDPRNHIVLTDVMISGFHARVERGPDGRFMAQDRGSTNGSFLNEEPLTEIRIMGENDALRMGNTTLVLKVVE